MKFWIFSFIIILTVCFGFCVISKNYNTKNFDVFERRILYANNHDNLKNCIKKIQKISQNNQAIERQTISEEFTGKCKTNKNVKNDEKKIKDNCLPHANNSKISSAVKLNDVDKQHLRLEKINKTRGKITRININKILRILPTMSSLSNQ